MWCAGVRHDPPIATETAYRAPVPPIMAVSPLDHATSPWAAPRSRSRRRGRIRATAKAWINGWELDRQLAAGCDPETDAALEARARRITSRRSRRRLADGLARVQRTVEPARPAFTAAARLDAAEVLAARSVLASLERRLRDADQIAAPRRSDARPAAHRLHRPAISPDRARGARQQASCGGGCARTRRAADPRVSPSRPRRHATRRCGDRTAAAGGARRGR